MQSKRPRGSEHERPGDLALKRRDRVVPGSELFFLAEDIGTSPIRVNLGWSLLPALAMMTSLLVP